MAVYLHQKFPRSRWFRSKRRSGWLPTLALPVLATLLGTLPLSCWAEAETTQAAAIDEDLNQLPPVPEKNPLQFSQKFKVTLPEGETEIIRRLDVKNMMGPGFTEVEADKAGVKVPGEVMGYAITTESKKSGETVNVITMKYEVTVQNDTSGPMEVIILIAERLSTKGKELEKISPGTFSDSIGGTV